MKINCRQFSIMTFFLLLSLKFLALPSLIYNDCKTDSWLVFVLMILFDLLVLYIVIRFLLFSEEERFFDFLKNRFGIVITKILCLTFFCVFMIDLFTGITGVQRMLVENFYNEFDWYIYLIPLLSILAYIAYKGLQNIGRLCELFVFLMIVGLIFIIVKGLPAFDPTFFLPFMTSGVSKICGAFAKHISWFGTPGALLFCMGNINRQNWKKSTVIKYTITGISLILIFVCVFFGVFKTNSGFHSFAISDLSQVSNYSTALDELSWLVISIWVTGQILQLTIIFYATVFSFRYVFGVKNSWLPILIINVLIISYQIIGNETIDTERVLYSTPIAVYEWAVKSGVIALIFFANLFYCKRKRRLKNEKP